MAYKRKVRLFVPGGQNGALRINSLAGNAWYKQFLWELAGHSIVSIALITKGRHYDWNKPEHGTSSSGFSQITVIPHRNSPPMKRRKAVGELFGKRGRVRWISLHTENRAVSVIIRFLTWAIKLTGLLCRKAQFSNTVQNATFPTRKIAPAHNLQETFKPDQELFACVRSPVLTLVCQLHDLSFKCPSRLKALSIYSECICGVHCCRWRSVDQEQNKKRPRSFLCPLRRCYSHSSVGAARLKTKAT